MSLSHTFQKRLIKAVCLDCKCWLPSLSADFHSLLLVLRPETRMGPGLLYYLAPFIIITLLSLSPLSSPPFPMFSTVRTPAAWAICFLHHSTHSTRVLLENCFPPIITLSLCETGVIKLWYLLGLFFLLFPAQIPVFNGRMCPANVTWQHLP